jgi:hypothetical protein
MNRVWISSSGRALLLDFVCPRLSPDAGVSLPLAGPKDAQEFLNRVAAAALRKPVPLHAQPFLTSLASGGFEQAEFIVGNLHSLASKSAQITRAWRSASLAMMPFTILLFALFLSAR